MGIRIWMWLWIGSCACGVAAAETGGLRFEASLSGAKVQPQPVATALQGRIRFAYAPDRSRLVYRLRVRNARQVVSAQLRCAPAHATGPVVAELLGTLADGWNDRLEITAPLTAANLAAGAACADVIGFAVSDPGSLATAMTRRRIYVQLNSLAFPEGEARGQVRPPTPTTRGADAPQAGNAPTIIATSTPTVPVGLVSGGVAIGIVPATSFIPATLGATFLSLSPTLFSVPVSLLSDFAAPIFATATLSIPKAGFNLPFASAPASASLLFPSAFTNQPLGIGLGPSRVAIPDMAVNVPITLQTASGPVAVTATLTLPAATLPLTGTPADGLQATLSLPSGLF